MLNIYDIDKLVENDFDWIIQDGVAFGKWINTLWPQHLDISFLEKKEYFLRMLKKLLDENIVVLFIPNGVDYKVRHFMGEDCIWDASNDDMILHIRNNWPASVTDENDITLNNFWYDQKECPGLGWVDIVNNKIVSS